MINAITDKYFWYIVIALVTCPIWFTLMLAMATTSLVITLFYRPFWDTYWVPFVDWLGEL
jgi:hypothetical protein